MARRKRIFRQNCIHHVMLRGVNGHNIFIDQEDYVRFCLILQAASEKHKLAIHGFCLMTNHIHLAIEPLSDVFHQGIHAFAFRYAQHFNTRHDRKGYLFQGRYRSILVDNNLYLKRLIRYIHLNPLEANLVSDPVLFPWSSYSAYLQKNHFVWLTIDYILNQFGKTKYDAIDNLVNYTNQNLDSKKDADIFDEAHRKGGFDDLDSNEVCFASEYKFAFQTKKQSFANQFSLDEICHEVCRHFGVNQDNLIGESKVKSYVDARSALALIIRKTKRWSLEEAGAYFHKSSGTMSRLANRAESHADVLSFVEKMKSKLEI